MDKRKIKILMLAAEATPIAKVGGLGDVIGALPKSLNNKQSEIIIFLPFYGVIDTKLFSAIKVFSRIKITVNNNNEFFDLWKTFLPGSNIPVYLIKHKFFNTKKIYWGGRVQLSNKYSRKTNDIKRFTYFTYASLEAVKKINFQPNIVHAHDWHTALAADYIKNDKSNFFKNTKTIYTIHNLANQGIAKPQIVKFSKLDPSLPIIKADLKNGDINFMVQGILSSDAITTVSPTYAKEILTHYEGAGLDNIIKKRKKDLFGILNGIDTKFFNPAADKFISKKYSIKNLNYKIKNKLTLQKKLGLPQDKNIAVAGLISRFVWQKGLELFTEKFLALNCQFIFLGTGEKKYETFLKNLAKKYPKKIKVVLGFDEALAHQIYAGADIFLMPSRFEPCGLGQMISMRYGTVPIVRATGGLADTVNDKTGFKFKNFNSESFNKEINKALNVFYDKPKNWRQLQTNGMKKDFSWDKSAKEYLRLYKKLIYQH